LMHNEKEGMPVTALREIKILRALSHHCIVNILDMFVVRSKRLSKLPMLMSALPCCEVQRRTPYLSTWSFPTWTTTSPAFSKTSESSFSLVTSNYT
jgi:serine/threonine protein kinase